ncbi:MAG: cytochrome-c peroxidase [Planctomycetia bacterium]|nr:cytochrome-c peroxidase [Planctomycetia bacterium]
MLMFRCGILWVAILAGAFVPAGELAPLPERVPEPKENPTTEAKVALGRQLFFDVRLSGRNDMSCATCHDPAKALADGLAKGKGFGGKTLSRNTPTLFNVAFQISLFWDGRAKTLEEQALGPIASPDEMHQEIEALPAELEAVPDYARQFRDVFGGPATAERVAQALAAYERTLVTRRSPLDRYLAGEKDALSAEAKRGRELFLGDAGCVRCHNGPLLSDGKFYRVGVDFRDKGLGGVTGKKEDLYKFRTPALRDVARTAPYMHDGSLATLDDVVRFYFREVPSVVPDGLALDIEPLQNVSLMEAPDIVAFLEALSGEAPKEEKPKAP